MFAITTDLDTDTFVWATTLRLAEQFKLPAYDAANLELAQPLSLPMASLDQDCAPQGVRSASPCSAIDASESAA